MLARVSLQDDLDRIALAAQEFANEDEELAGVVATEPDEGRRVYLCAFRGTSGRLAWLALDDGVRPVGSRSTLREVVSMAAMCELAEESAGGGDLDELRSRLVALRLTDNPPGIDEAEEATAELQRTIGAPPRIASPAFLDRVGTATQRLELALGAGPGSPFAEAMKHALASVDELAKDVEAGYKGTLS